MLQTFRNVYKKKIQSNFYKMSEKFYYQGLYCRGENIFKIFQFFVIF